MNKIAVALIRKFFKVIWSYCHKLYCNLCVVLLYV